MGLYGSFGGGWGSGPEALGWLCSESPEVESSEATGLAVPEEKLSCLEQMSELHIPIEHGGIVARLPSQPSQSSYAAQRTEFKDVHQMC